jgi:hypothetical protein
MIAMTELSRRPDYEHSDASPALLAGLAAGLAGFVVFTTLGVALVYPQTLHQADVGPVAGAPGPRLQVDPKGDLAAFRQAETAQLRQYAWIDRAGGRVRIPIDRALTLTAERGLPGWRKP